jgi:hypothetical protein
MKSYQTVQTAVFDVIPDHVPPLQVLRDAETRALWIYISPGVNLIHLQTVIEDEHWKHDLKVYRVKLSLVNVPINIYMFYCESELLSWIGRRNKWNFGYLN